MSGIGHMMLTNYSAAIRAWSIEAMSWTGIQAEGETNVFTVVTTTIPIGSTLYWTINHITTSAADFSATSGSFTITGEAPLSPGYYLGSFNVVALSDGIIESPETYTVSIRTGSVSGPILFTPTASATLRDKYTMTQNAMSEGTTTTFTVTVTNPNDYTLYWTINHITTSAADFSSTSGSVDLTTSGANSMSGTFALSASADSLTEGSETFTISLRTYSVAGTIVYTSGTLTISDISTTPLDTISTNLTTANRIVYAQAAQGDLIPISAAEFASYSSGVTGLQAQSGMKDGAYASYNTISSFFSVGPQRQTSFSTTYWTAVQTGGYVFAVKIRSSDGPNQPVLTGFQIGYGTTTTGAGVALSNKLTRSATTDANSMLYFVVKQPSVTVPAGALLTILVGGFSVSFVGQSSPPANNAGTVYALAGASSSTPITSTLNNPGQYNALCISWLSTTTRPW